jgi:hypothetical protein
MMVFLKILFLFISQKIIRTANVENENEGIKKIKENKTLTLRTVRDLEQNMIFNDVKHSRTYFDEVQYFSIIL